MRFQDGNNNNVFGINKLVLYNSVELVRRDSECYICESFRYCGNLFIQRHFIWHAIQEFYNQRPVQYRSDDQQSNSNEN